MSEIARHTVPGVWPFHNAKTEAAGTMGLVFIKCGNSIFTSIKADVYVDNVLRLFKECPENWFNKEVVEWINKYIL